jgi:hypothetical protein
MRFPLLLLGIYLVYLAILVLGRMNFRDGPDVLNAYYIYTGYILFFMVLSSAFVVSLDAKPWSRLTKVILGTALLTSVILSGMGVQKIRHETQVMADIFTPFRERILTINRALETLPRSTKVQIAVEREAEIIWHGVDVEAILYRSIFDPNAPSRLIVGSKNTYVQLSEKSLEPGYRSVPNLIRPGTQYNTFFDGTNYVSTLHQEGPFDPNKPYTYSIQGSTLDEVQSRIPQMLERRKDDIVSGKIPVPPGHVNVEQSYEGYNILSVSGVLVGVRQADGAFSFERLYKGEYTDLVMAKDIEGVRQAIRQRH